MGMKMGPVIHVPEHGRIFFDHDGNGGSVESGSGSGGESAGMGARVDLATIAGPSRVVRNDEDDDAVFGFATGDEIAMDLD
jgi:hypothetical protein